MITRLPHELDSYTAHDTGQSSALEVAGALVEVLLRELGQEHYEKYLVSMSTCPNEGYLLAAPIDQGPRSIVPSLEARFLFDYQILFER